MEYAVYRQAKSEVYTLQFRFDAQYPISAPAVTFVVTDGRQSPIHPVRCLPSHSLVPVLIAGSTSTLTGTYVSCAHTSALESFN